MQATLPARNNVLDAIAPRVKAEPAFKPEIERSTPRGTERAQKRDDFASKLSEARERKTAEPAKSEGPEIATREPTAETEPTAEAAPVEETRPVDDAAPTDNEAKGEQDAPTDQVKKSQTALEPALDAELVVPEEAAVEESEPAAEVAPAVDDAAALAAAMNTAAQPIERPLVKDTATVVDDHAEIVDTTVAAAIATRAMPASQEFVGGPETNEPSEAVSPNAALAANLTPADRKETVEKPANSAKPASAANANDAAIAASVEGNPTEQEHGSRNSHQEQPKQGEPSFTEAAVSKPDVAPVEKTKSSAESAFDQMMAKLGATHDAMTPKPNIDRPAATPTQVIPPEQKFAADNVDNVVKNVRTQIDAGGGQMRMRLDPPELGALEVAMKMVEGRMTASFTTSNDQATQLLSHSLNDLKASLEASGITVDRIQVRQSSANNDAQQQPGDGRKDGQSGAFDQSSSRGDQQRREAVEKMWRKLAYGSDELDFVA